METNGALYFVPGSHLVSPITKRFIRLPNNKGTGFEPLPHETSKESSTNSSTKDDDYVLVTCKPGPFFSFIFLLLFCTVIFKKKKNLFLLPSY